MIRKWFYRADISVLFSRAAAAIWSFLALALGVTFYISATNGQWAWFVILTLLLFPVAAATSLMHACVRRKILAPMHNLDDNIRSIQKNETMREYPCHDDEMGLVMRRFYSMKEQIDVDLEDLKKAGFTDSLTGLYSRRYFFQVAQHQAQVSTRNGHSACLLVCDADHFKRVNDTYGHLVGDSALKHIATLLSDNVRESDVCARFGGEEFIVLLNNSNIDNSILIGEKVRAAIERTPCKHGAVTLSMTVSIGVSDIRGSLESDVNEAFDRADKALYAAKNGGRNQVRDG